MTIVSVAEENIADEHICCSITEKKGENCVSSKKAWLKERFADGLVFEKLDERGKVFIEYIPAEKAWYPIEADGYMHIDCFWVSGRFKGQGHANELLGRCIEDTKAQGKLGLTVLSSAKKMPFLSDPKFLKYKGFELADTAAPYFELLYLPFTENAPVPSFTEKAKQARIDDGGLVLYHTDQCPFAGHYARLIHGIAQERGVAFDVRKIETLEQAKSCSSAWPTYSLFRNGEFVTNEILSEKKFVKLLDEWKLGA